MSQAKRIPKYQEGNKIPEKPKNNFTVKVDNRTVTVSEEELDNYYQKFIQQSGSKTKNVSDWNKDYISFKETLRNSNGYFDFDTAGGVTIGASTDIQGLSNNQRGYKNNGKEAKDGFGSSITGVKNAGARNSILLGQMGSWMADALKQQDTKAFELEARQKTSSDQAAEKLKSENISKYDEFIRQLDIANNIYGPQIGMDPTKLTEANYRRFWEEEANQSATNNAYLKRLKAGMSNELFNDPEFAARFKEKTNYDWNTFRDSLGKVNLDASDLNYQNVYDSLGMGQSYRTFSDKNLWDNFNASKTAAAAEAQREIDPRTGQMKQGWITGEDGKEVYWMNGLRGKNIETEDGRLAGEDGTPYSGVWSDLIWEKGNKFTGSRDNKFYSEGALENNFNLEALSQYDATDYMNAPIRYQGMEMPVSQYLQGQVDKESDFYKGLVNTFSDKYQLFKSNNAEGFDRFWEKYQNPNMNPYLSVESTQGVKAGKNVSNYFTNTSVKDGRTDMALILEETEQTNALGLPNVRYKLILKVNGQPVEKTGRLKKEITGDMTFISDDGSVKQNLGQYNPKAEPIDTRNTIYGYRANGDSGWWNNFWNSLTFQEAEKPVNIVKRQSGGLLEKNMTKGEIFDRSSEFDMGTVLKDDAYEMTNADVTQLIALGTDLAGLGFAFVPGANVASATTGAIGSFANYGAETAKSGDWTSGLWGLATNLGLDATSLLPVVGGGAKAAKIVKNIRKHAPKLTYLFTAMGAGESVKALEGIMNGDTSINNFRALAAGLTGVMNSKNQLVKGSVYKGDGAEVNVKVNGADQTFKMSQPEYQRFEGLGTTKEKADYVKTLAVNTGKASKIEEVEIDVNDAKFGWNPLKWRMASNNLDVKPQTAIKSPSETNWWNKGVAKREAIYNPTKTGADEYLGGWERTPLSGKLFQVNQVPVAKSTTLRFGTYKKQGMSSSEASKNAIESGPWEASPTREQSLLGPFSILGERSQLGPTSILGPRTIMKGKPMKNQANRSTTVTETKQVPARIGDNVKAKKFTKSSTNYTEGAKKIATLSNTELKNIRKIFFGDTDKQGTIKLSDLFAKNGVTPKGEKFMGMTEDGIIKNKATRRKYEDIMMSAMSKYFGDVKKGIKPVKNTKVVFKEGGQIQKFQTGGLFKGLEGMFNIVNGKDPIKPIIDNSMKPGINMLSQDRVNSIRQNTKIGSLLKGLNSPKIPQGIYNRNGSFLPKVKNDQTATVKQDPLNPRGFNGNTEGVIGFFNNLGINSTSLSEFGRAMYNRKISGQIDTRVPVAMASAPNEIYSGVKGDYLTRNLYDQSANRLENNASEAVTSDGAIQQAMQLSANSKAADIRNQGIIADIGIRRQQETDNLNASRNYAQIRSGVANENLNTLAARDNAKIRMNNEKKLAMAGSVNNFWANENMKNYQEQMRKQGLVDQLNQLDSKSTPFGNDFRITDWRGKTPEQISTSILERMNAIYAMPETERNNPQIQTELNSLIEQSKMINDESKRIMLKSMINGNNSRKINIFGNNIVAGRNGMKLSKKDRFDLQNNVLNNRNQAMWVREYNRWVENQARREDQKVLANIKSLDTIMKVVLKAKK